MGNLAGEVTINGTTGTNQVTINAPSSDPSETNVLTLTETKLTAVQPSGAEETINLNLPLHREQSHDRWQQGKQRV